MEIHLKFPFLASRIYIKPWLNVAREKLFLLQEERLAKKSLLRFKNRLTVQKEVLPRSSRISPSATEEEQKRKKLVTRWETALQKKEWYSAELPANRKKSNVPSKEQFSHTCFLNGPISCGGKGSKEDIFSPFPTIWKLQSFAFWNDHHAEKEREHGTVCFIVREFNWSSFPLSNNARRGGEGDLIPAGDLRNTKIPFPSI